MPRLPIVLTTALLGTLPLGAQSPAPTAIEVVLIRGNRSTPLNAQTAEPVSHNHQIAIFGFSSDVWAVPGKKSPVRVKEGLASFEIRLSNGSTTGEDFCLVRLKSKGATREVGRDHDTSSGLKDEDRLALVVDPVITDTQPQRRYRVTPKVPLKPGEYALVVQSRFFDFAVE